MEKLKQRIELIAQRVEELELSGGGSGGDSYTKTEINNMLALKSDKSHTYTIEQTNYEIDEVFGIENYNGTTLPNSYADILRLHKPIMVNDEMLYFLEENANGYIYFELGNSDNSVIYKLYRIDKSSRIIYEWLTKEKGSGGLDDLTEEQLAALNSGITSAKVTQINTNTTAINNKQNLITSTNRLSADLVNDSTTTNKFVTNNEKTTWNNKQDRLTTSQLSAVNSGITSAKVSQIDTNTTAINNKQDRLTTRQLNAVNSGITSEKVSQIEKNNSALIGLINSGQKNLVNAQNPSGQQRVTIVNSANGGVVISCENATWATTAYNVYITPNEDYKLVLYVDNADVSNVIFRCFTSAIDDGGAELEVLPRTERITETGVYTLDINTQYNRIKISTNINNSATAGSGSATIRMMLCSKAAWDISNQYVPYRPSYDELVARIEALENA